MKNSDHHILLAQVTFQYMYLDSIRNIHVSGMPRYLNYYLNNLRKINIDSVLKPYFIIYSRRHNFLTVNTFAHSLHNFIYIYHDIK